MALAVVIALQRLSPTHRAVVLLRDVLGFRAAEVAKMLAISESTVNRTLQRARCALEARLPPAGARAPAPESARERSLVDGFAEAFERDDVERVVALLTDGAWLTILPGPFEGQGRETIAAFLRHETRSRPEGTGRRLVAIRANGQPAFGHYARHPHAKAAQAVGIVVLTLEGEHISAITRFNEAELLPRFGLPLTL